MLGRTLLDNSAHLRHHQPCCHTLRCQRLAAFGCCHHARTLPGLRTHSMASRSRHAQHFWGMDKFVAEQQVLLKSEAWGPSQPLLRTCL
jgi:hypothetical protein